MKVLQTLWVLALIVFVVCVYYPVGTKATRPAGLMSFALLLGGIRSVFLEIPAAPLDRPGRHGGRGRVSDASWPSRFAGSSGKKYIGCLKRYEGVLYVWGGENAVGNDCSGLIRRGLMDALFLEGAVVQLPGLVRDSIKLWWNDTTARVLGEASGPTVAVMAAPRSISSITPSCGPAIWP